MEIKNIQNKVISAIASYFALDTITKQLGTMPNLDAKTQAMILTALGLFLPEIIPASKKKDDMQTQIVNDVSDNFAFVGISMLIPTLMQQNQVAVIAPAGTGVKVNGYGLGENPFQANSYINGYGQGKNPFSTNSMINGNFPGTAQYINCPSELPTLTVNEYLADMNGNPIAPIVKPVSDYVKYCN